MRNRKIAIIVVLTLVMNIIFSSVDVLKPKAEINNENNFIEVEEEIKDIQYYEGNIIIIDENDKGIFYKDNEKEVLKGEGYIAISNKYIINEDGDIFDIEIGEFLEEDKIKYINIINEILTSEDEEVYFFENNFAKIMKKDNLFNITYYSYDDEYKVEKEVKNLKADYIKFDYKGYIYIVENDEFKKYTEDIINDEFENNNEDSIIENLNEYKVSNINEDNFIIFKENKYSIIDRKEKEESTGEESEKEELEENNELVEKEEQLDISTEEESIKTNEVDLLSEYKDGVSYQTHVQGYGWQEWKCNGDMSGTSGEGKRLESIKILTSGLGENVEVSYRTHVQSYGWQPWVKNGEVSGTEGQAKRLEAIEINLLNAPVGYHIEYRVHVQGIGWQGWKRDGQMAGTLGESKRLEAIEIRIVEGEASPEIEYSTSVFNEGWKSPVLSGQTSGSSSSNRVQGIKINLNNPVSNMEIQYRGHIQSLGWDTWKKSGEVVGNITQNKRLEAIEIKLVNAPSDYQILYRTNVKGYGWQGWKSDGQTSGTVGLGSEIIAIEIKLVKNINPNLCYQTHVQSYGWQAWKSNGQTSGTTGQAKRLEGIVIKIDGIEDNNLISYRTHVQSYGWQEWKSQGQVSGTTGEGKRLEAIQIKLNNPIEGYKLYYRVHVQGYGWQEWKASGEIAGTTGEGKRLEAIEIKLVKDKNKLIVIDAGHNYGGDDGAYSKHSGITYIERDLNMQMAIKLRKELELKGFEVAYTRNPQDRESIDMKSSLKKRVDIANNLNADFFISIHQNSSIFSSPSGVEAYYSSAKPISGVSINSSYKVSKSSKIASDVVSNIAGIMKRNNRGIYDDDFYVVKNTHMPSILLECGFISNSTEAKKLANSSLQLQMANIIAEKINSNL